jgi:MFS family permease
MQFVVIEWEVYRVTKDPLSLGIIGLVEVIPAIGMALFAGHVVDRSEKRNLLLKALLGFLSISAGLFLLTWPTFSSWFDDAMLINLIYLMVFLGGIVRAFIGPSVFSLFSLLLPKEVYPNGSTWSSMAWQFGAVAGPAVGGLSIGFLGAHWSMLVVVVFASISTLLLWLCIPVQKFERGDKKEGIAQSLKEGLRFVFRTKEIFGAISLDMFAVLFGGAVALLPVFAQDILKVGSVGFGFLRAAPAVGSFLIMIVVTYYPLNANAGRKLLLSIFGFGVCIIVFGLSELYWVSLLAMFFSGVFDGVSVVIRQTILQLYTPDHMRGRVSSVNSIFVGSSNELGAFESGFTARLMGTVNAVVFGGVVTLLTVIGTGTLIPSLRNLDFDELLKDRKMGKSA